jgi:hypothetical protein
MLKHIKALLAVSFDEVREYAYVLPSASFIVNPNSSLNSVNNTVDAVIFIK